MDWVFLRIMIATVGEVLISLIGAIKQGSDVDYQRVKDIIPSPLRAEALLAREKARQERERPA